MRYSKAVLGAFAMLAIACSSVPSFTIPPINIPSIPPIDIPTDAPDGQNTPAAGNMCGLISLQEIGAAAGGTATVDENTGSNECTWTIAKTGSFIPGTINLRLDSAGSNDLAIIKSVWSEGQDVPVGDGGWWGKGINVLWFLKSGNTYAVQLIFLTDDEAGNQLVATNLATLAASRL